jgi:tRNA-dihydrouridine synthase A
MVAANAICHENRLTIQQQYPDVTHDNTVNRRPINYENSYLLRYLQQGYVEPLEGASVLQLGGSDPQQMYDAAATIMELTKQGYCNYTAINLNCGCPSPKVAGKGCFGAALMQEAPLVSRLTQAIYEGSAGTMPVTVKCRIGTDSKDDPFRISTYKSNEEAEYNTLCHFIETVASNQIVTDFAVHARIAVIHRSFSPADNRKIPPLQYNIVRQLVKDFPHLQFTLNGGINTLSQVQYELEQSYDNNNDRKLQGIMVGRAFAADPWSFAMADELLYGIKPTPTTETIKNRLQLLQQYGKHADAEEERVIATGGDVQNVRRFIIKAVTPLFAGEINAKKYRIALDEITKSTKELKRLGKDASSQPPISELIINAAMGHLSEETLLRTPMESYERILREEHKQKHDAIIVHSTGSDDNTTGRSATVDEWQQLRKVEEMEHRGSYDNAIAAGI